VATRPLRPADGRSDVHECEIEIASTGARKERSDKRPQCGIVSWSRPPRPKSKNPPYEPDDVGIQQGFSLAESNGSYRVRNVFAHAGQREQLLPITWHVAAVPLD